MTANDVYRTAVSFLFEKPREDAGFYDNFLSLLNLCLQEALPYQNSRLRHRGEEPLEAAPVISEMEEEIEYDDEIVRCALPFGVVSYYYQDEVDNFKAQDFRGRFIVALSDAAQCVDGVVEDIYGYGVDLE